MSFQYVRYLEESKGSEADVRSVYHRACMIHLQEKFRPHLSWAAFEEEHGEHSIMPVGNSDEPKRVCDGSSNSCVQVNEVCIVSKNKQGKTVYR